MSSSTNHYKSEYKLLGFGTGTVTLEANRGLTETFFVPAYQLDYRWTRDKLHKLLDDISESEENKVDHYSLQPILARLAWTRHWSLLRRPKSDA